MRKVRIGISFILFLLLTFLIFSRSSPLFQVEHEITSKPSHIRDGDTFEIPNNPAIRLADIDCPESYEPGGPEATFALKQLIEDKTVYLDVDNVYRYDTTGSRYVCLVYVDYNSTHLLNVNHALVVLGQASIDDHDNQWDPYFWTLYVAKPSNRVVVQFFGASVLISLILVIGLNWMVSRTITKLRK